MKTKSSAKQLSSWKGQGGGGGGIVPGMASAVFACPHCSKDFQVRIGLISHLVNKFRSCWILSNWKWPVRQPSWHWDHPFDQSLLILIHFCPFTMATSECPQPFEVLTSYTLFMADLYWYGIEVFWELQIYAAYTTWHDAVNYYIFLLVNLQKLFLGILPM